MVNLEPYSHSSVSSLQRPITTLCWGHRDSRLFLACGPALYIVRVEHRVASLQLLCQQGIATAVKEEKDVAKLTMPSRLCSYVTTAFVPTIKVTQDRRLLRSIKTIKINVKHFQVMYLNHTSAIKEAALTQQNT